jgi:uncharacterized protein YxeA
MKSILIIIIAVIFFGLTSCVSRSAHNHSHDHENCTEHDHVHVTPNQESFKVEADSTLVKTDTVVRNQPRTHSHNGRTHTH